MQGVLEVVDRDVATKESLSDAQFIADSARGKTLRMDLVAQEENQDIVRRLNFLANTRDVIASFKDDYGKNPEEAVQVLKPRRTSSISLNSIQYPII